MKDRSRTLAGILLLAVGFLLLGLNYDLITWDFDQIARFWPILLVIGGFAVFLHPNKSFFNTTTALCLAFSIPLAIYSAADRGIKKMENKLDLSFDSKPEDYSYREEDYNGKDQSFKIPLNQEVKSASLDFGGGAAEFVVGVSKNNLFEAKTAVISGSFNLSEQRNGSFHDIDFQMKGKNGKVDINEDFQMDNKVLVLLNEKPSWKMDFQLGAADADFDLSPFKIEKLSVETGAASVDVKLGKLQENMKVEISSGVASIRVRVPKEVGCRIEIDGALNSKNFDGFSKSNGYYYSPNYEEAAKKIDIEMDSALSSLDIKRY